MGSGAQIFSVSSYGRFFTSPFISFIILISCSGISINSIKIIKFIIYPSYILTLSMIFVTEELLYLNNIRLAN